jgi:hypothetical protein
VSWYGGRNTTERHVLLNVLRRQYSGRLSRCLSTSAGQTKRLTKAGFSLPFSAPRYPCLLSELWHRRELGCLNIHNDDLT